MRTNIFVNGSAGFIGSAYCSAYPSAITFGHKAKDNPCMISHIDTKDLKNILKPANVIVHLEAYGANNNDLEHIESLNKLRRVIECSPFSAKLIYISSATIYDNVNAAYCNENSHIGIPNTLYLQSKIVGETMVRECCSNYTILRLANVVGPGLQHGVIKNLMSSDKTQKQAIYTEFPGEYRSFIHIDDVCDIIYNCAINPITNKQIINVAGKDCISIYDIFKLMGIEVLSFGNDMGRSSQPSITKLQNMLPHVPIQSSREAIMKALQENGYAI